MIPALQEAVDGFVRAVETYEATLEGDRRTVAFLRSQVAALLGEVGLLRQLETQTRGALEKLNAWRRLERAAAEIGTPLKLQAPPHQESLDAVRCQLAVAIDALRWYAKDENAEGSRARMALAAIGIDYDLPPAGMGGDVGGQRPEGEG